MRLIDLESARSLRERPDNPDDFDLILRADSLLNKPSSEQRLDQVQALLEQVLQRKPTSLRAITQLAIVLINRGTVFGRDIPADVLERARRLVRQAEAIDPTAISTLATRAYLFRVEERWPEALVAFQRLSEAIPNNAEFHLMRGICLIQTGHPEEAIEAYRRAIQLDPRGRDEWLGEWRLGQALLILGRYDEAISALERAQDAIPENDPWSPDLLADFGRLADGGLHPGWGRTPMTAPGAKTILTVDLVRFLTKAKPLLLDINAWGLSIPGAIGLQDAGKWGTLYDTLQERLRRTMYALTHGDAATPIVTMSWNSESFAGRNLAIRLVALGYSNVYWYRGGREAWEVSGLPETELSVQPW